MTKLIYLPSGQQAELINELPNNQYLVDPLMSFQDPQTGEYYDVPSGVRIVNQVFDKPPIEKIAKDVSELLEQKKLLTNENSKLRQDNISAKLALQKIETKIQDISKWQIDLSKWKNCKTIHFFTVGDLTPKSVNKPKYTSGWYSLHWSISIGKGDDLQFNIRVETESYSGKDIVDEDYGFMFDLTDEDIKRISLERAKKMDLSSYTRTYQFKGIPSFLKIDRVLDRLKECEELEKKQALESYTKQIEDLKEKIKSIS